MTTKNEWYAINAPIGKRLGYPQCCIDAFCNQPPGSFAGKTPSIADKERVRASYVGKYYTGFIPCHEHAIQVLSGKIALFQLIKNRDTSLPPFPFKW